MYKTSHREFPSPPWETHVWLLVYRAAVFVSMEAQSHLSTAKCIPTKLHVHLATKVHVPCVCSCSKYVQKFPSPPCETHVLLVVCRAAVSMSRVARWSSRRAPSVGTQRHMCVLMCSIVPIAPMGPHSRKSTLHSSDHCDLAIPTRSPPRRGPMSITVPPMSTIPMEALSAPG
jgi:hypothetical protein